MKRFSAAVLALLLGCTALSGCRRQPPADPAPSTHATQPTTHATTPTAAPTMPMTTEATQPATNTTEPDTTESTSHARMNTPGMK